MGRVVLRRAEAGDATTLTNLMHGSAAYRGDYASILDGYAVTEEQIATDLIFIAERNDQPVGFYSLTLGEIPELDLMFVADHMQGSGLGRLLFDHMRGQAAAHEVTAVLIVSHPPAFAFYQRMSAVRVGTKPPGRTASWERPILSLAI